MIVLIIINQLTFRSLSVRKMGIMPLFFLFLLQVIFTRVCGFTWWIRPCMACTSATCTVTCKERYATSINLFSVMIVTQKLFTIRLGYYTVMFISAMIIPFFRTWPSRYVVSIIITMYVVVVVISHDIFFNTVILWHLSTQVSELSTVRTVLIFSVSTIYTTVYVCMYNYIEFIYGAQKR